MDKEFLILLLLLSGCTIDARVVIDRKALDAGCPAASQYEDIRPFADSAKRGLCK